MKRTLSLLLAGFLTVSVLAGCGSKPGDAYQKKNQAAPAPQGTPVTLKIGQMPTVDGLPFWVAEQKDYYNAQGVKVELITFKSANERDVALTSGDIDGALTDPMGAITLAATGTKVKITSLALGATKNEGPMAIYGAKGTLFPTVRQLKGVEIAISTNTVMHYVAEKLLLEGGLAPEDIKTTAIPQIPLRFEALMSGKVKAALLPEPYGSLALKQGAYLIASDKDAKQNYSHSVIIFNEKAIKEKADGIRKFYVAYNRGVLDLQANPDGFVDLLIEKAKVPEDVKQSYKNVAPSLSQAPKKDELESVVQWLVDKKIIANKLTYEQVVDTSFVTPK